MASIRGSTGLVTVVLSVLGLLLCLAAAAGVWMVKGRLDVVVAALFETADEAFEFIETRLVRVIQTTERSRQRVSDLSSMAERLKDTAADSSAAFEPLLQPLDEIYGELQSAEHWLHSSLAVAQGVHRVSAALVLSDADASGEDGGESAGVTARRVAEFSAAVADALARLDGMRQEVMDLRDKKTLAREFAAVLLIRASELDAKLANVSTRIDRFQTEVATARVACNDLGRSAHWWTTFATVTLALTSFWFGVSQIAMLKHGWRLARPVAGRTG